MTLDIRGSLKNTRISKNPFVVFDELLSNAIDSFLIRKDSEPETSSFSAEFAIEFLPSDLFGDQPDMNISCTDNGCGLGHDQLDAFLTKDTSYKDDLEMVGIGHCKGTGRVQFFHHFSELSVQSNYRDGGITKRRDFSYDGIRNLINANDFKISAGDDDSIGTKFHLSRLKPKVLEKLNIDGGLRTTFSCASIKGHLLVAFLQRLVGLKTQLGDFEIVIVTSGMGTNVRETLTVSDLPELTSTKTAQVQEQDPSDGTPLNSFQEIIVSHYKLDAKKYRIPKNAIALCAKSSPVRDITNHYLRSKTVEANPVSGFYHLVLIEGLALDGSVNEQRDNFDLPEKIPSGDLFQDATVSLESIFDSIDDIIGEMVGPPDWDKEKVLQSMVKKFGVSETMLSETQTRIRHGDAPDTVVERVLKKYQERIISETSAIFELKEEIKNSEPDTEEFRAKINELAWKYTSGLKDIDKANLSQLVVRRAAIVEILSLACAQKLNVQNGQSGQRRKDERLIHSIFFPMQRDSHEVSDHDIWLLNEEYHYYHYIASDKPLSGIKWDDGNNLFDDDIDSELEALLLKNASDNAGKRPDIALFNKEGSAIIIEFKAPGVSMDDHVGDLMEYAQLLAAKSGGRLKKFYGYLIGDTVNTNRMLTHQRFPTGKGFFGTHDVTEYNTGQRIGELYSEILYYDDVVDRADQRLTVYKEKLGIDLS